ncbi:unnamed protein product [Ilex paraguariensis]|uniref:ATP-dependent DNA ligase family profile domain-containing protein n=1 Tax=Ilex paraguariensis TaxID=185542 RepID=A0ABC8TJ06_9AQUA
MSLKLDVQLPFLVSLIWPYMPWFGEPDTREPCWSLIARSVDDVERFFKETIENRDEGIVLKDFGSKWEPSDRSGKWLKLKPEYIRAGSDLDALIIGGYYGSGRRGGEVAQFLLASPSVQPQIHIPGGKWFSYFIQ